MTDDDAGRMRSVFTTVTVGRAGTCAGEKAYYSVDMILPLVL